jgi:hypothetical protein
MRSSTRSTFRPVSALLVLFSMLAFFLAGSVAAEPRVTATLSSDTVGVGESVDYELTVDGAFSAEEIAAPAVNGLEVRGTSQSSQLLISGSDFSRRTTLTYRLIPQRQGTFTIPPVIVTVEGRKLTTKSLTLKVTAAQQATEAGDFAFAEIRLGKKAPYVGEAVPIEVRLYLDNGPRWELRQQPVLSGSGFTLKPFGKFSERPVEMAGKNYIAVTFRSVITPGKAGTLKIGPLPVKTVYSDQRARRFGMFAPPGRAQELEVTAPAVEIDAQLLPSAGRPGDFSGAIGKFTFEGIGTPNRVNVGEPVQMVLKVSGEGNFDRVTTPTISDPAGWRVYDAENKFEPTDELGFSGTKTFTLPVAPTTRKSAMPVFSFNYFDPETGKYQILKTAATPLTVTGADLTPPVAAPAPAATIPTPANPSAAAPAAPAPAQDILGILP